MLDNYTLTLALTLFNAVPKLDNTLDTKNLKPKLFIKYGIVIMPDAIYAKDVIINFFKNKKISGEELNKTFHKSWNKIKQSSRTELFIHQLLHYLSTYGTNFQGKTYIPAEKLDIPDLDLEKFELLIINAIPVEELISRSLDILKKGIALKLETIRQLIDLITALGYKFTGKEGIKNKEANIILADRFNILPEEPTELFRFIIYNITGETLLINNSYLRNKISVYKSNINSIEKILLNTDNQIKLAQIFNRYKDLFLSIKLNSNNCKLKKAINKISKLSKIHHKPIPVNPLNNLGHHSLTDSDLHWFENATPFALLRAIAWLSKLLDGRKHFFYKIRNGKIWVDEKEKIYNVEIIKHNFNWLLDKLKKKFNFQNKAFLVPDNIEYGIPTSEKNFVGNLPFGTSFTLEHIVVGIRWFNKWGARDLDLSALSLEGKIGWNSMYKNFEETLFYSGDMTNAPNGAVEYLHARKLLNVPNLVFMNVYSGLESGSEFDIIIAAGEDEINVDYMMNPNNLIWIGHTASIKREMLIGFILPWNNQKQKYILMNLASNNLPVSSGTDEQIYLFINALYEKFALGLKFNDLMKLLGAKIYYENQLEELEKNNIIFEDFRLKQLTKDKFIKLFN